MLSKKEIVCPENLLKIAKSKGTVKAVIVNAGKLIAMKAVKQAVDVNLIEPIFVGDKAAIDQNGIYLNIKLLMKLKKIIQPL